MPIKGTKQKIIVYTGTLYEDAENACKQGKTTVSNKCAGNANARAVSQKDARRDAYILLARSKGYDESAELYAAPVGIFNSFCNLFWFETDKYIVKNPPKAVRELKPISAAELCAEPKPTKSKNSLVNDIILAIDGGIDSRNAVSNRAISEAVKAINDHSYFVGDALTIVRNDISEALSNCANRIIDAFEKPFGIHAKNFVRYSEEARAGFKTLEVIAESSIEAVELLKKIDAKLDRLDTRQEEMNERLSGLAQIETGISANVAKTVTFVDRFTKR